MSRKYTYEEIKETIEKLGYELISKKYVNNRQKLILKDIEGYYYISTLDSLKRNVNPNKFGKSNPYTIQNIKLWCKLNNKSFELISDVYEETHKDLYWKCLKNNCREIFRSDWSHIHNNRGCPFCTGYQVGLSNCLATLNPELAKEWHPTLNKNLTPYDVTLSGKDSYWWLCKKNNNHEWQSTVYNRNNGSGCPQCNNYKGEKRCKEVFMSQYFIEIIQEEYNKLLNKYNNTYFISQKKFKGLVGLGGRLLSYDFYIPKYNLLIEYQGEFHDGTARNQTKEQFKIQVEHDRRKKEYAERNGYNFLEIWYYEFDNIEEILNEKLLELKECV